MSPSPTPLCPTPGDGWRIRAEGDRCLIVELGDTLDPAVGARCLALARTVREAGWPGLTDIVPALATVAFHYRPPGPDGGGLSFDDLSQRLDALLRDGLPVSQTASRTVDLPVCYGGEYGPDLEDVARACGLSPEAVVDLHTRPGSLVYTLGFAPGLPYIGVHDPALAIPRRATPRTAVPAGSVAIANRQTTIYPDRLPGGWHLIGTTPLRLFDFRRDPPALLMPGDQVRFVPITPEAFTRLRESNA